MDVPQPDIFNAKKQLPICFKTEFKSLMNFHSHPPCQPPTGHPRFMKWREKIKVVEIYFRF